MPFRLTTDQNSVFVLGVMSGVMAFFVSSMAGANNTPSALPPLHSATLEKVTALPAPPEPARVAPSAIIMNQRAAVRVDDATVKFFFASGKTEIAKGAKHALKEMLAGAKNGQSIQITGFHDNIGDPQSNAELAKQRAIAVKSTLMDLGVAADSIELIEPEITIATVSNAQARRVEVRLRP